MNNRTIWFVLLLIIIAPLLLTVSAAEPHDEHLYTWSISTLRTMKPQDYDFFPGRSYMSELQRDGTTQPAISIPLSEGDIECLKEHFHVQDPIGLINKSFTSPRADAWSAGDLLRLQAKAHGTYKPPEFRELYERLAQGLAWGSVPDFSDIDVVTQYMAFAKVIDNGLPDAQWSEWLYRRVKELSHSSMEANFTGTIEKEACFEVSRKGSNMRPLEFRLFAGSQPARLANDPCVRWTPQHILIVSPTAR